MELDVLEILLGHAQHITAVGQEYVAAILILGHILIFTLLEVFKLLWIIALYPTCFVEVYWLPTALSVVLVLQSVLNNLELQLAYGTYNLTVVELIDE